MPNFCDSQKELKSKVSWQTEYLSFVPKQKILIDFIDFGGKNTFVSKNYLRYSSNQILTLKSPCFELSAEFEFIFLFESVF